MRDKNVIIVSSLLLFAAIIFLMIGNPFSHKDPDQAFKQEENMVPIASGRFLMGSENHRLDEKPVHAVSLSSFDMDRYEVTYKEYRKFLEENPAWRKGNVAMDMADLNYLQDWEDMVYPQGQEKNPVVYVSWFAASAYAQWAGKQLPTEAQWEYASRGGAQNMDYPWGNTFRSYLTQWRDSDVRGSVRVGIYTVNGFGLNDMVGNVGEWTADGYELYQGKEKSDPLPRINNHLKVVRGGSWKSRKDELRVSARRKISPNASRADVGFRCVSVK